MLTVATSAATPQRCVVPNKDLNHALDIDEEDELLGQGEGQEDDGGNDNDEMCEDNNGDSSANTHLHQYLPPIVNDSYQHHIDYIKKTKGVDLKPHIYTVNGTFWLPHKSNFFILHGHSKPWLSQLYMPHFFLWDPEHLIQGGLQCLKCQSPLKWLQFTHSHQAVDLKGCFYMIGQCHCCLKCKNPQSGKHTMTYNSWDPHIQDMLLYELQAEFPAVLSHQNAISADIFTLMHSCFNYGIGSKQFSHILLGLHHQCFSQIHVQYFNRILSCTKCTNLNNGHQESYLWSFQSVCWSWGLCQVCPELFVVMHDVW